MHNVAARARKQPSVKVTVTTHQLQIVDAYEEGELDPEAGNKSKRTRQRHRPGAGALSPEPLSGEEEAKRTHKKKRSLRFFEKAALGSFSQTGSMQAQDGSSSVADGHAAKRERPWSRNSSRSRAATPSESGAQAAVAHQGYRPRTSDLHECAREADEQREADLEARGCRAHESLTLSSDGGGGARLYNLRHVPAEAAGKSHLDMSRRRSLESAEQGGTRSSPSLRSNYTDARESDARSPEPVHLPAQREAQYRARPAHAQDWRRDAHEHIQQDQCAPPPAAASTADQKRLMLMQEMELHVMELGAGWANGPERRL